MERQGHDTGKVVIRVFRFGEVSCDVVLSVLNFAEDVEQEDAHIPFQIFMVKEKLGQKSQVLAVDWVLGSVDFEH